MRHLTPLLLVLIVGTASAQFGGKQIIEETETAQPNVVELADLDGDGDNDLVAASMEGNIAWYANDGAGNFGPRQLITATAVQARGMDVGDLDGDGDPDVLACSSWNDEVFWFENDGAGSFTQHMITTTADGCWFLSAVDLDGDGDLDALRVVYGEISWYENDGAGNFGASQVVDPFFFGYSAATADLNGDGSMDLIAASPYNDGVFWFANDGTGSFGSSQVVALGVDGANHAAVADLDGDGDVDVLSASWISNTIAWYENDGAGNFGPLQVISASVQYGHFVHTADLDGDGDADVLSASSIDDKIAWYANDGAGNFGAQQVMTTTAYWANSLATGDADGDGDLDVFSTSWEDDKLAWYENDGAGDFGPQVVLSTSASYPMVLHAADLDADGDADLLVGMENSNDSRLAWYENLGGGNMGPQQEIIGPVDGPRSLRTADLDGDGDPDLLSASFDDQEFAWYANDGSGGFGPRQIIDTAPTGAFSIWPADLDGDGDQDVLCGYSGLRTYLNDGLGNFSLLSTYAGFHMDLRTSDLDGDGDPDLLSTLDNELVWAPNDGSGIFGTEQVITTLVSTPTSLDATDLDGDGDADVLASSYDDGMITWYANDGFGNFGAQQMITLLTLNPWSTFAADLDLDGDNDVVSVSFTDNKVAWYQNDGTGVFGPQLIIDNTVDGARSAIAADMDGDGDPDLVNAGQSDAIVAWYENHAESPYRISGTVFLDADLNGSFGGADVPFPYSPLSVTPLLSTVMTGSSGGYTAFVDTGLYDLESLLGDPLWTLTTAPAVQTVSVTTLSPQITGVDFGWAPLVDTSIVVPGFTLGSAPCWSTAHSWLSYVNQGTHVEQGSITLTLDPLFTFISSVPPPSLILSNAFTWDYDSLGLFQIGLIAVQVQLPSADSIGIPWTNLTTVTTVDSLGDTTGVFSLVQSQYVGCAFDPNDKQVEPQGYGVHGAVPIDTDWLTYTIRFQNTGTDTALNVTIADQLDAGLDRSSLQILGASHAITSVQTDADGEVEFRFDGILLPDSNVNEPASHGYLKYRIRPMDGAPDGTVITNTAAILFDLNPAVVTNTVTNTLIDCALFSAAITSPDEDLLLATAGEHYQWFINGDSIAGATSQLLVVTFPGAYSVAVMNEYGCVDLSDVFDVIHFDVPEESALHTAIFPSPTNGDFILVSAEEIDAGDVIELIAVNADLLRSIHGSGTREVRIDGSDLPSGLYLIRVLRDGAQLGSARVVIE